MGAHEMKMTLAANYSEGAPSREVESRDFLYLTGLKVTKIVRKYV